MFIVIDCQKCSKARECEKKGETQRRILFSYSQETSTGCKDYDPVTFRGLEGVAA